MPCVTVSCCHILVSNASAYQALQPRKLEDRFDVAWCKGATGNAKEKAGCDGHGDASCKVFLEISRQALQVGEVCSESL